MPEPGKYLPSPPAPPAIQRFLVASSVQLDRLTTSREAHHDAMMR
jgi:hypothetical protein